MRHERAPSIEEPTIDHLLLQRRDKADTLLVVEHKPERISIADHVVDVAPTASAPRR